MSIKMKDVLDAIDHRSRQVHEGEMGLWVRVSEWEMVREAMRHCVPDALPGFHHELVKDNSQAEERGTMKVWFDTEFIEDGRTIELLSIGAVREDGAMFYAECEEADRSKAGDWVKANVLPHLTGGPALMPRRWIAESLKTFCGERPEIWAYYADYDWVALCQLYGTMMDLPKHWPKFCLDVKQLCVSVGNPKLPAQTSVEHHALADARWTRRAWEFLNERAAT